MGMIENYESPIVRQLWEKPICGDAHDCVRVNVCIVNRRESLKKLRDRIKELQKQIDMRDQMIADDLEKRIADLKQEYLTNLDELHALEKQEMSLDRIL